MQPKLKQWQTIWTMNPNCLYIKICSQFVSQFESVYNYTFLVSITTDQGTSEMQGEC